ncbi:MAG: biotin transporter BioY [Bdellovibrionota bacterium]
MRATATKRLFEVSPTASQVLSRSAWIVFYALATALAAQVKIPLPGTLVPMTLQTAIVLLAGLHLGAGGGAISQLLYISGGVLGLPFFAGGTAALLGPTGGYLIGFVLAAWTLGFFKRWSGKIFIHGESFIALWLMTFAASIVLFVPGVIQLKYVTVSTWETAFAMGVVPFIIGDLLKVSLTVSIYRLTRR